MILPPKPGKPVACTYPNHGSPRLLWGLYACTSPAQDSPLALWQFPVLAHRLRNDDVRAHIGSRACSASPAGALGEAVRGPKRSRRRTTFARLPGVRTLVSEETHIGNAPKHRFTCCFLQRLRCTGSRLSAPMHHRVAYCGKVIRGQPSVCHSATHVT